MVNAVAAVLESPKNFQFREFPIPEVGADETAVFVPANVLDRLRALA